MNKSDLMTIWILCKKNIALYIKRGPVLIFGLMFPFFITLSWVIGRDLSFEQIFIGIIAMTSFFTSTAISPVVLPQETREKSLERQLYYPISVIQILLGILIASVIYSFIITTIITISFALILSISFFSLFHLFVFICGMLLIIIVGSLLGLLVSSYPSDRTSDIMVIINLIKFPLIFISGIFIPLNLSPLGLMITSLFSPITYFTDSIRFSINNSSFFNIGIDILILLAWVILLLMANIIAHRRTMPKRLMEGKQKKGQKLQNKAPK